MKDASKWSYFVTNAYYCWLLVSDGRGTVSAFTATKQIKENILLQILDEGRITDAQGRSVNFENTIIIMTSNIGSQYLLEGNNEENRKLVKEELKVHFKPEFLNRIDEIVMFNSLDSSVVRKIIDKFIGQLVHRLQDKKITISLMIKMNMN